MPTSTPTRSSESAAGLSLIARARRAFAAAAGFTLIELSVILFVLAIAVSFLIPRLRDTDHARLGASAERLATTARYLYEEAAFRQRPMRLNFDLDAQTYWVTILKEDPDSEPEFVPDGSPLSRPAALPEAVSFVDVVLPAVGTVTKGTVFAQFLPEGAADPLVVHLQSRRGDYATMALDALTGRTRIGDGYFEIALADDEGRGRDRYDRDDTDDGIRATDARGRTGSAGTRR